MTAAGPGRQRLNSEDTDLKTPRRLFWWTLPTASVADHVSHVKHKTATCCSPSAASLGVAITPPNHMLLNAALDNPDHHLGYPLGSCSVLPARAAGCPYHGVNEIERDRSSNSPTEARYGRQLVYVQAVGAFCVR
jgi:hypothetical protein